MTIMAAIASMHSSRRKKTFLANHPRPTKGSSLLFAGGSLVRADKETSANDTEREQIGRLVIDRKHPWYLQFWSIDLFIFDLEN